MTLERIDELKPRQAVTGYTLFMTIWIVAFARTERALPTVVVLVLLLLPALVHFGLGYVVADWRALYLAAVPIVVAAVAGGLPSALWAAVVLLTAPHRGRRVRPRLARAARPRVRRSLADLAVLGPRGAPYPGSPWRPSRGAGSRPGSSLRP